MTQTDYQYLRHLEQILEEGELIKEDRTKVGCLSYDQGIQLRFDHRNGIPILTTKKIFLSAVISELLWILFGEYDNKYLKEWSNSIWNEWIGDETDPTPLYGYQWRNWMGAPFGPKFEDRYVYTKETHPQIDQVSYLINKAKKTPFSRRLLVTAWNPLTTEEAALPACHTLWQIFIRPDYEGKPKYIDMHLYQRSGDYFIGIPFNITSYAILLQMIANELDLIPRYQILTIGDAHIYTNHIKLAQEQLKRREYKTKETTLVINGKINLENMTINNKKIMPNMFYLNNETKIYPLFKKNEGNEKLFEFFDYTPLGYIKADIAK